MTCVEQLAPHAQHDEADATFFEVVRDLEQLGRVAGKAIRLGDRQHVAFADKPEGLFESVALRDAAHLLLVDFLGTNCFEVTDLRLKPGDLISGGGPAISDNHRRLPLTDIQTLR